MEVVVADYLWTLMFSITFTSISDHFSQNFSSVDNKVTCFLSRHPTQTNFSLRYAIESLFDSFCLTPLGKYFRFPRTVPVMLHQVALQYTSCLYTNDIPYLAKVP